MLVCDRFHNTAYRKTVKIVIDKDQDAESDGCKLCTGPGFDLIFGIMAESGRTAGTIHQTYHSAQNYQEYKDADIIGIGQYGGEAIIEDVRERHLEGEAGIEQPTYQDSDKE